MNVNSVGYCKVEAGNTRSKASRFVFGWMVMVVWMVQKSEEEVGCWGKKM